MAIFIIIIGVVVGFGLLTYFRKRHAKQEEQNRLKREEHFEHLLDLLKKSNEGDKDEL